MASSIGGGGNYFSQINQQIAKGPDLKTAENLRQTGGTANTQRQTSKPGQKVVGEDAGGLILSDAAQKSLQTSHKEAIEGHEHELAHQAGLHETDGEGHEAQDLKMKRGYERDQEQKAEPNLWQNLPEGAVVVDSPEGVKQILRKEERKRLKTQDEDLEELEEELLGDIPQSNLEAAGKVMDTQLKQGVKKMANLKQLPEAREAALMQLKGADFMVEPLDIRDPGNQAVVPLQLDFPEPAEAIEAEPSQPA
jgi:hypothetical protein